MLKTKNLINLIIVTSLLLGCEKQYLANDGYIPEVIEVEAKEEKEVYFFESRLNFDLNQSTIEAIEKLLKNMRSKGVDNVEFMLISNQSISLESQKKIKKQIYGIMYKHGFLNSRIIDSGICIYKDAKIGVRINILKYNVKSPNCETWSEYIGDTDTNKNLPKHGAASTYNLVEMIANQADFVAPRKYKGAEVKSAIAATKSTNTDAVSGGSPSSNSSSSNTSRISSSHSS